MALRHWGGVMLDAIVPERRQRCGPMAIQYRVAGEWLSTAEIAADPRNLRHLGQKGVQSRIDRLKAAGLNPVARRGDHLLGRAEIELDWGHFTRSAERGHVGAAKNHHWKKSMVTRDE